METTYLVTRSGLGIEVQISEDELAKLKEALEKGDTITSVDE